MADTAARSPRKRKGLGPERREEILAAALRLFAQYGLYGVSTRQIAAAVGISQPTLYAYFPSKHAMVEELHERAFKDLHRRLVAGVGDLMTRDSLASGLRIYVDFGLENPDAYRVAFMIEDPIGRPASGGNLEVSPGAQAAFGVLRASVAAMHAQGLTRSNDPEQLAQSLWAGMHGLVSLLIARPEFPWVERETLIRGHLDLLIYAAMRPEAPG
jgi:AcrR family transcriptional regulator